MKLWTHLMIAISSIENRLFFALKRTPVQMLEREYVRQLVETSELYVHAASRTSSCKQEDDIFDNQVREREKLLCAARDIIDHALIDALDTFPINTPCTINVVAKRIGMQTKTAERLLISTSFAEERDDSSPSRKIVEWNSPQYTFASPYRVNTMLLPNWRFVDSGKYVERYEVE